MATKYESSNPYSMASIFPSPDAPPSVVRSYLARILMERHEVEETAAHSLVANWKYGTGDELRRPEQKLFVVNFGEDLGPRLYKAVEKDNERRILEERVVWRRSTEFRITTACMLLSLLSGVVYLMYFHSFSSRSERLSRALLICAVNAVSFTNAAFRYDKREGELQIVTVLGSILFWMLTFGFFIGNISA